jgi:tetratricopeptide (TPR) repeat protein
MTRRTYGHVDSAERLAARLREARSAAGLRQSDLAFPGCSTGYVSRIEKGERVPSLQVVRELARRLGVTESWLAKGENGDAGALDAPIREAELALRLDHLDLAEELFTETLDGDHGPGLHARAEAGLGQLAFRRDDAHGALRHLERAVELDSSLVSDPSVVDTLGRALALTGETDAAITLFRRRLEQARSEGDEINGLRFTVLLANALIDATGFDEAGTLLTDMLESVVDADPVSLARLYWSQSRLHALRREPAAAARYAQKALDLLEATDYSHYRSRAHQLLAFIELDAGRPERALELVQRGRELAREDGTAYDEAKFTLEEARALAMLGRPQEAAALAMSAAAGLRDAHPVDVGRSYAELGSAFAAAGELERAREVYELAIEYLEGGPSRFLAEVYVLFGGLLERLGDAAGALDVYRKGATLTAELGTRTPA